jgi:hypothetical protein
MLLLSTRHWSGNTGRFIHQETTLVSMHRFIETTLVSMHRLIDAALPKAAIYRVVCSPVVPSMLMLLVLKV